MKNFIKEMLGEMKSKPMQVLMWLAIAILVYMFLTWPTPVWGEEQIPKEQVRKEMISGLEGALEWHIANPVVAEGIDPALPYKDLLSYVKQLEEELKKNP